MDNCPRCEYQKQRAQMWRHEAYKQAGHPLPEREWVGLTHEDIDTAFDDTQEGGGFYEFAEYLEAMLKLKNGFS